MKRVDLSAYLDSAPLEESLVLRFHGTEDHHGLVLAYDYPHESLDRAFSGKAPLGLRTVRQISFVNVSNVRVSRGEWKNAPSSLKELERVIGERPVVVTLMRVQPKGPVRFCVDLSFGTYGRLKFEADRLVHVSERALRHVSANDTYVDAEQGVPVDLRDPFAPSSRGDKPPRRP